MVVAPSYPMLRDATYRSFRSAAERWYQWVGIHRTEFVVTMIAGDGKGTCEVLFRSGDDPERMRGPNLSGIWMDEASLLHREAYQIGMLRLREGSEAGWLTATFTPKGLSHWTYDVFGTGKDGAALIQSSTRENPFLAEEFLHQVCRVYTGPLADQELSGAFVAEDEAMQVVPASWVSAAQARWSADGKGDKKLSAVGVDVARGGADKTVLAKRYGMWFAPLEKVPGRLTPNGPTVAALVTKALAENPGEAIAAIDVIGIGASAFDFVKDAGWCKCIAVNFAESAKGNTDSTGRHRFANLRAFAYWSVRELLDPANGHDVALPPDPELLADLTAPRWQQTSGGIKIEPKEDIADRLGRSPDCGDAIALSILTPKRAMVKR